MSSETIVAEKLRALSTQISGIFLCVYLLSKYELSVQYIGSSLLFVFIVYFQARLSALTVLSKNSYALTFNAIVGLAMMSSAAVFIFDIKVVFFGLAAIIISALSIVFFFILSKHS